MPVRFDCLVGNVPAYRLFDNIIDYTMSLPNMKVLGTNDPSEQVNVLFGWVKNHCELDEKDFKAVKNAIIEVQGYDPEAVQRLYQVVTGELEAFFPSRTSNASRTVDPTPWMPYASEEEMRECFYQHYGHYPEDNDLI